MQQLMALLRLQFPQWLFELASGYNICLYGYGDKSSLLNDFVEAVVTDPVVVVKGYSPSLTLSKIVGEVCAALKLSFSGFAHEKVTKIAKALEDSGNGETLYLVVHSIDGVCLRAPNTIQALSVLAKCPRIRVLASFDHINTPLVWDAAARANFNWVFHNATTYQPYRHAVSESGVWNRESQRNASKQSAMTILPSLTRNARQVFRILGYSQLLGTKQGTGRDQDGGLMYEELYRKSREGFVVSNETTFRHLLVEFVDHRLMAVQKLADGSEFYSIMLEKDELSEVLDSLPE